MRAHLLALALVALLLLIPLAAAAPTFTKLANPADLPGNNATAAAWTENGDYLAIAYVTTSPYFIAYSVSGTTYTKLADPATVPTGASWGVDWNPAGTILAVAHANSPGVSFYERSGSTLTKLGNPATLPAGDGYKVEWSPNGAHVAVTHQSPPYFSVYSVSGTTFTKLANPATTPTGYGRGLSWSPDGSMLAITHDNSPYLSVYTLSGSTLTKNADPAALPNGNGREASWSPDGAYFAMSMFGGSYFAWYSVSGTTFTKLTNPATMPGAASFGAGWSPDSNYLAVGTSASPYVLIYERSGSTLTKLSNPATLPPAQGNGVAWTTAGDKLAVSHVTTPFVTIYDVDPPASAASPPDPPTDFVATGIPGGISLEWEAPADEGSSPVTNYRIYRSVPPEHNDAILLAEIGTNLSFIDYEAAQGEEYTYFVRAVNTEGESESSNSDSATALPPPAGGPGTPSAPIDFRVVSARYKLNLRWEPPLDKGEPPLITHYAVYKGTDLVTLELLALVPSKGNVRHNYADGDVESGTVYCYAVAARNGDTLSNESLPAETACGLLLEPTPLTGENGAVYGGRRNQDGTTSGSREELAATLGVQPLALDVLYGLFFAVGLSITGFVLFRGLGAAIGAVGGTVLALVFGFFPVWLVAFLAVALAAAFALFLRRDSAGA